MKILVAGGLGFIGSKVIEKLCVDHDIICVDSKEDYNVFKVKFFHNFKISIFSNSSLLISLKPFFKDSRLVYGPR